MCLLRWWQWWYGLMLGWGAGISESASWNTRRTGCCSFDSFRRWNPSLFVSCQHFLLLFSFLWFLLQLCVMTGVKNFDTDIFHPEILHFCIVYASHIQCVKALWALLVNLTRQMEHYPNPLHLVHIFIWKRACKNVWRGKTFLKKNMEAEWIQIRPIRFLYYQQTDSSHQCSRRAAMCLLILSQLNLHPPQTTLTGHNTIQKGLKLMSFIKDDVTIIT